MENSSIDARIREILNRRTYSNDNDIICPDTEDRARYGACGINITGNNNIIIKADLPGMLFLFIANCLWMYLCSR